MSTTVPPGKLKIDSKVIKCSNRYDDLRIDNDAAVNSAENKNYQVDVDQNVTNLNISNNKRPQVVINQHPERQNDFNKPVSHVENGSRISKITILSDSIPKGIRFKEFNNHIHNGYAKFKVFPGATISNLNYYAKPTLDEEKPDVVTIHVGINNLLNESPNQSTDKIVDDIINMGRECMLYGVEKVMISGITECKRIDSDRITNVNRMINEKCKQENFIFVNNDVINHTHLWKDGLHLNENGKVVLANNVLKYIN